MMVTLDVKGYKEAKDIMDQLTNQMQKRILRSALRTSLLPMLRTAKANVPKRTGRLVKQLRIVSWRKVPSKTMSQVALKHVFERTKKGNINEYYGRFVHYGTDERRPKKNKYLVFTGREGKKIAIKSAKGLKPNPYLENAYRQHEKSAISLFGDILALEVQKFVRKKFKPISR